MGCIHTYAVLPISQSNIKNGAQRYKRPDVQKRIVGQINTIIFEERQEKAPVLGGLVNIGNTCYMNSSLQSLFHTSILNKQLSLSSRQGQFTRQYKRIYEKIKYSQAFEPYKLKQLIQISNPQFRGDRQNDAGELISTILNIIAQETNLVTSLAKKWPEIDTYYQETDEERCERYIKRDQSRSHSIIDSIFTGRFKTTYQCSSCKKQLRLFQKFNLIYLPIPLISSVRCFNLQDCIKQFQKPDILDSWECLNCGEDCEHVKTMSIFKANKVLIFCLKRFTQALRKNNAFVDIPSQLSLSLIAGGEIQGSSQQIYDLYGTINHSGYLQFGHYTALCFNQHQKQWFQYNDRHAFPISNERLEKYQRNTCIVFYRHREESKPVPQRSFTPFSV